MSKELFTPSGGIFVLELLGGLAIAGYVIYEYNKRSDQITQAVSTVMNAPATLGGYVSDLWNDPYYGTTQMPLTSQGTYTLAPGAPALATEIFGQIPQLNGQDAIDLSQPGFFNTILQPFADANGNVPGTHNFDQTTSPLATTPKPPSTSSSSSNPPGTFLSYITQQANQGAVTSTVTNTTASSPSLTSSLTSSITKNSSTPVTVSDHIPAWLSYSHTSARK